MAIRKAPAKKSSALKAAATDWRPETFARLRTLILEAAPGITETVKWRKPSNPAGVPVWEHNGILCTGETYKDRLKLTFMLGASLKDPSGLFNASLDAGTRRAIDIHETDRLNEKALTALVREAVKANAAKRRVD